MLIRVDMREDALHGMFKMNLKQVPQDNDMHVLQSEALPVGDVILSSADGQTDYVVFERKSLQDLAASIRDGRYKEQSLRLQALPNVHNHNVVYMETHELIHNYADKLAASPAPYGHYHCHHDVGVPAQSEEGGVVVPVGACCPPPYCSVLSVKQVKCENITPQNIGEIMLCNIPGVSCKTAAAIVKKYPTLRVLMEALKTCGGGDCLADIMTESESRQQRKLSKKCIQNIYNFLMA